MIGPNLARRPFLNTRPVWIVTAAAMLVTLVMVFVNVRFYVVTDRELAERIEHRAELTQRHTELLRQVGAEVEVLERVPWTRLAARVRSANAILREGAFSWLELLDDIESVLPYDVRLTRIAPSVRDDEVSITLTAVCKTRDDLLELLQRLIDDPRFSDPTPKRESPPEESDTPYYTLDVSVTYRPGSMEVAS